MLVRNENSLFNALFTAASVALGLVTLLLDEHFSAVQAVFLLVVSIGLAVVCLIRPAYVR
jgi:hypothetical protein